MHEAAGRGDETTATEPEGARQSLNAADMERMAVGAATAESNGCIVVTDNERDFAGVECINPLRGMPS